MQKVLLVEDDDYISSMYYDKFHNSGFDISLVRDPRKALETARSFQPDCILLDMMMPELSGLDVLAMLKKDPAVQKIPTIILSNVSEKEMRDKARSLGAVHYLVKAMHTPGQIVDIVRKTLIAPTAPLSTITSPSSV